MVDTVQKVYDYLVADTGSTLYASVGTRIWSPVAPADFRNTSALIVFHIASETSHPTNAVQLCDVTFKCYGGTGDPDDARTVYRQLHDRLHARGSFTNSIHRAFQRGGTQTLIDPETHWPYVLTTYRVIFHDQ